MPNRYVCYVLEEMRDQLKQLSWRNVKRYKQITGLMIEEAQTMVNRMESALYDWNDLKGLREKVKKKEKQVKKLKEEIEKLEEQKESLKKEENND